jgi:glycosyltransferase involved in cell wall biosynthesis
MSETRILNVASYNRIESLVKSLESIIDQCDVINVTLNSHDGDIPEILYHDKINLILSDNSLGDAMKFYMLDKSDGYFLTIDDDLIYPPNYVEYMIAKCKEYGNTRVMTLHGRNFSSFPITSYYRSATERYACLNTVNKNVLVQFGGTGVMCFHTDLFKVGIDYFMAPNMADVWIGRYCLDNKIEILCLRHESGFIKYIPQKTTIYDQESKSDKIQTDLVNGLFVPKIVETKIEDQNFEKQIEFKKSIELAKKQINYEKINSIFNFNNPNIVLKEKQEKQIINLKLNTSIHSKMFPKNKKR